MLEELIEKIKRRLLDGAYPNEAAVSFSIVVPILRTLGWDDSDPEQVMPEYANAGRRVDFALCATGKRPSLFIEVKGVGRVLDGDRQLFEYAFHEGIPLCLLTDGREWSFYLPGGQGSYDERRVYRLQITDRSSVESAHILRRYLERSRIKSGEAFEDAMRDYRDNASRREAARNLPLAWKQLVDQPEDLLVELLSEQTANISGFRPSSAEITTFLRSLKSSQSSEGSKTSPRRPEERNALSSNPTAEKPEGRVASNGNDRVLEYTLFGTKQIARNAAAALVDILKAVAERYPDKMAAISVAARGRSRNHIASSPEEIYPARPDLARAVEIAPGWLVGLNIANREKIRIIREACRVAGIRFGSDIVIKMPNVDIPIQTPVKQL